MPYLNPEIFPDDWEALINTEEDCCEELRRAVRQLWLRQLSANRISTQNDAQLQNAQIHFGVSCRMLAVVDRIPDPGSAPSQPPSIAQRIYVVGGASPEEPRAHVSGSSVKSPRLVQRFSLAGLVTTRLAQTLGGRQSWCSTGFYSETHGYVMDLQSGIHVSRLQFSDESLSFLTVALGQYWDARAASSTHRAWIFGGLRGASGINTLRVSGFSFLSEQRTAVVATADHALSYSGVGLSDLYVYLMGGGFAHSRIQRFTKSSDALSVLTAQLAANRLEPAYCSSATKSYVLGGINTRASGAVGINSIEALTHSGETVATVSSTLATAKTGTACEQALGNGFVFGGRRTSRSGDFYKAIDRFDLATEVSTVLSTQLQKESAFGAAVKAQ